MSPTASPTVSEFSMLKLEAVVVARTLPPTVVIEFAKISPSASTRKRGELLTARPMRLVSAAADGGLIMKGAFSTLDPATPVLHAEKECGSVGTKENSVLPRKEVVALAPCVLSVPPTVNP